MTRRRWLMAAGLLVALSGCKKLVEELAPKPKTMTSIDGTLEVVVPALWLPDKLNDRATLQVASRLEELYVIVLSDAKEDLATEMSLEKFSEITRTAQLATMANGTMEGPSFQKINELNAIEYVLKGSVNDVNVVMKHVSIDGAHHFHQVLAWTLKSKWAKQQTKLAAVVESLKEVPEKADPSEEK